MIILTDHAIKRIAKRLLKRKSYNVIDVYRAAIDLYKNSKIFEKRFDNEIRIFALKDNYVLVGKKLEAQIMSMDEIKNILNEIINKCREKLIIIFNDSVINISNLNFLNVVGDQEYRVFFNFEKCVFYFGNYEPVLIFTYRPLKRKDLEMPNFWIINIRDKFIKRIRQGKKHIELRKFVPKDLKQGDIIFIYSSKQQKILGYFILKEMKVVGKSNLLKYIDDLGISKADLFNYLSNTKRKRFYLLFFDKFFEIESINAKLNVTNIQKVPKDLLEKIKDKIYG